MDAQAAQPTAVTRQLIRLAGEIYSKRQWAGEI